MTQLTYYKHSGGTICKYIQNIISLNVLETNQGTETSNDLEFEIHNSLNIKFQIGNRHSIFTCIVPTHRLHTTKTLYLMGWYLVVDVFVMCANEHNKLVTLDEKRRIAD